MMQDFDPHKSVVKVVDYLDKLKPVAVDLADRFSEPPR
jgi:hypothetical protein